MPQPSRSATANALLARLSTDRGAALSRQVPGAGLGTSGLGGYPAFGGMSPAVSQQYDYLAGRPVAASALPRNVQDFLAGAFGPTVPMVPMPIDLPQSGQERPDPRRFQYPVGYNLPSGTPGSEGLKLACYSDDTEVLTRAGWKLFRDVQDDDEVATRHPRTHEFEWQLVQQRFEYDYTGPMVHFTSRSLDVLVTPNHRMLYKTDYGNERVAPAAAVAELHTAALPATSVWVAPDRESITFTTNNINTRVKSITLSGDDFAAFMGMYISEGCCVTGDLVKGGKQYHRLFISQKAKSRGYEPYKDLLTRIFGREPYYDGVSWIIYCRPLWDYLVVLGKSHEKYLSSDVLDLSARQLELFWTYYCLGDGTARGKSDEASTVSKELADDLQEVLQKVGSSGSISVWRQPNNPNHRRNHSLLRRSAVYQHCHTASKEYDGKVYCVSVPNSFVYVRRNGKPAWSGNSFQNLRAFADIYSVARSCINVRENEILGVEWDIVPTDDAAIAMREDSSKAEDFQKRVREAVAFFRKPDPAYKSYIEWMRALLEDIFVVDAASLYLHPPSVNGYGVLKSNLASLEVIDGTTLKPLVDIRGGPPRWPQPAYAQYLYGVPRRELTDLITAQDLELDGEPVERYRGDQLLYLRHQPRSFSPYGFSVIEQCIIPISIGVKGQTYTLNYYTEGTLPDTYVQDGRPSATPQQSYQLQEMLNSSAGDLAYRRKVFVLPFGSRPFPMKPQALTGGLAQEYAEYTCMVIDVSPQEVGLSPGGGRGGGLGGKGFTEQQENATFRKSLKPMLMWLKWEIFDIILQQVLGQADMMWKWKGFEPAEDLEKKNQILVAKRNAGFISTDEGRAELGLDPFGTEYTSVPYVVTASGMINLEDGSVIAISGGGATQLGPDTALGSDGKPLSTAIGNETPLHEAADEIDQRKPVPATAGKAVKPDAQPEQHTGVMVALIPPSNVASLIALPDGEAPEEIHCTLAFLGDADKLPDSTALLVAMRAFAQAHAPVQATLNGIGRFIPSGEDFYDSGTPIVINVDSPSLPDLRSALVNLLTRIGCPPVLNHGFSPHISIKYVEDDEPTPAFPLPAALPVTFSTLRVAIGGEVHDYPLSGGLKAIAAQLQASTVDTTDTDTARTLASSYLSTNAVMTLLTSPIARSHKRSRNREE